MFAGIVDDVTRSQPDLGGEPDTMGDESGLDATTVLGRQRRHPAERRQSVVSS